MICCGGRGRQVVVGRGVWAGLAPDGGRKLGAAGMYGESWV